MGLPKRSQEKLLSQHFHAAATLYISHLAVAVIMSYMYVLTHTDQFPTFPWQQRTTSLKQEDCLNSPCSADLSVQNSRT